MRPGLLAKEAANSLLVVILVGAPFLAMGLFIGYLLSAKAAIAAFKAKLGGAPAPAADAAADDDAAAADDKRSSKFKQPLFLKSDLGSIVDKWLVAKEGNNNNNNEI